MRLRSKDNDETYYFAVPWGIMAYPTVCTPGELRALRNGESLAVVARTMICDTRKCYLWPKGGELESFLDRKALDGLPPAGRYELRCYSCVMIKWTGSSARRPAGVASRSRVMKVRSVDAFDLVIPPSAGDSGEKRETEN